MDGMNLTADVTQRTVEAMEEFSSVVNEVISIARRVRRRVRRRYLKLAISKMQ